MLSESQVSRTFRFFGQPSVDQIGSYEMGVIIKDLNDSLNASTSFTLQVNYLNQPPVPNFTSISAEVLEDSSKEWENFLSATDNESLATELMWSIVSAPKNGYAQISENGFQLSYSPDSNYSGLDPVNFESVMRAKMAKVFPSLKDIRIDYSWSGKMGISVRRMPQIGRIKDSNVLYISGYSGHGVAPTHMTGRILAEAVDGNTHRFDIMNKMFHMPWPGGKLLRRPAMAVGMMWYKTLDAL